MFICISCTECKHIPYNLINKQISRTFQGFLNEKLQFSSTMIYSINLHILSVTPFWTPYWLQHVAWSHLQLLLLHAAMFDHIILYYCPQQCFGKWLGMTCNCIWGTETAFKIKKQNQEIKYFSRTLTELRDNFMRTVTKIQDLFKIVLTNQVQKTGYSDFNNNNSNMNREVVYLCWNCFLLCVVATYGKDPGEGV